MARSLPPQMIPGSIRPLLSLLRYVIHSKSNLMALFTAVWLDNLVRALVISAQESAGTIRTCLFIGGLICIKLGAAEFALCTWSILLVMSFPGIAWKVNGLVVIWMFSLDAFEFISGKRKAPHRLTAQCAVLTWGSVRLGASTTIVYVDVAATMLIWWAVKARRASCPATHEEEKLWEFFAFAQSLLQGEGQPLLQGGIGIVWDDWLNHPGASGWTCLWVVQLLGGIPPESMGATWLLPRIIFNREVRARLTEMLRSVMAVPQVFRNWRRPAADPTVKAKHP